MTAFSKQVLDEVAQAGTPISATNGAFRNKHNQMLTWMNAMGLRPNQIDDELLAMFLFSQRSTWSYGTAANAAYAISWIQQEAGQPDPFGLLTKRVLSAFRNEKGLTVERPVDALTLDELAQVIRRWRTRHVSLEARQRQALLVMACALTTAAQRAGAPLPTPFIAAGHVPVSGMRVTASDVKFHDPALGLRGIIDRQSDPVGYSTIQQALLDSENSEQATLVPEESVADMVQVLVAGVSRLPGAETARQSDIASLSLDQRDWMLRLLEPHYASTTAEVAYLLLGVVMARRNAEMRRLNIEHVRATCSGFAIEIDSREKSSATAARQGGSARSCNYTIGHIPSPEVEGCSVICPACALDQQLEVRRRDGARDSDPLFITTRGNRFDPTVMASKVRQMCTHTLGEDGRRFSTRTMRVTGATLASQQGMHETDIAELMMCSVTNTRRYNRHNPYPNADPLPLDAPRG